MSALHRLYSEHALPFYTPQREHPASAKMALFPLFDMMMEVNTTDTMQYAFMLSRIYLQLNINQHEVRALLADQLNPGLADQVEYLMHQCQLQLEEKQRERPPTEPKKRGVAASFPHGEVRYSCSKIRFIISTC